MSNARAKAERSKAKDARQTPAQDGGCNGAKRKRKPTRVWEVVFVGRGLFRLGVWHTAVTREQAEDWVAKTARTYGANTVSDWEIRQKPNT